ncbi:MAG: hypothetical protein IPM74_03545 [Crocinitomicaceae bacterium]|nr:hypothetical protein [Crocinitomicaceae bacterium]MBK8924987.1 hypothetical protein [Crocinitomicaceae bacterium]
MTDLFASNKSALDSLTISAFDLILSSIDPKIEIDSIVYSATINLERKRCIFIKGKSGGDDSFVIVRTKSEMLSERVDRHYYLFNNHNERNEPEKAISNDDYFSNYLKKFNSFVLTFRYYQNKLTVVSKNVFDLGIEILYFVNEKKIETPYSDAPITELHYKLDTIEYYSNENSTDTSEPVNFVYFERVIDSIVVCKNGMKYGVSYYYLSKNEKIISSCSKNERIIQSASLYPYRMFRKKHCGLHPYYWNVLGLQVYNIKIAIDQKHLDAISSSYLIGDNSVTTEELTLINVDYLINLNL